MKRREWIPNQPLSDSVLALEAALPDLERSWRRWYHVVIRILGGLGPASGAQGTLARKQGDAPIYFKSAGGAAGLAGDLARDMRSQRLAPLRFAVDELVEELTPAQRGALRERGELPDWFLVKAQQRATQISRDMREHRNGWT